MIIKHFLLMFLIAIQSIGLTQTKIVNCPVFPINNIWNTPIDKLPIHPKSQQYINTIGSGLSLRNDFGSGTWNNAPIGIPYVLVSGEQKKVQVNF